MKEPPAKKDFEPHRSKWKKELIYEAIGQLPVGFSAINILKSIVEKYYVVTSGEMFFSVRSFAKALSPEITQEAIKNYEKKTRRALQKLEKDGWIYVQECHSTDNEYFIKQDANCYFLSKAIFSNFELKQLERKLFRVTSIKKDVEKAKEQILELKNQVNAEREEIRAQPMRASKARAYLLLKDKEKIPAKALVARQEPVILSCEA